VNDGSTANHLDTALAIAPQIGLSARRLSVVGVEEQKIGGP